MKKQELREKYKLLRAEISTEDIAERSKVISDTYFNECFDESVQSVHCFLPIPGQVEVDTWLIINKLWEMRRVVITSSSDFKTLDMKNFILQPDVEIVLSKYGIPEPIGAMSSFDVPDHIIVPLLTFDQYGHRVGYGKGFYDRFLKKFPSAKKIGVTLFDGVEVIDDVNEYDVGLDCCITVRGMVEF